jgi:hypothetical protein
LRILFDQGTPAPLRRALASHVVETAFDLANRRIAILVLWTTSWPEIERSVAVVVAAVAGLNEGEFRELGDPVA